MNKFQLRLAHWELELKYGRNGARGRFRACATAQASQHGSRLCLLQ